MKKLNTEKTKRRLKITKTVLLTLAAAGVLAIPVAGPLTFMVIADELGLPRVGRRKVYDSLRRIEKQRLIGVSQNGDTTVVGLTKNGQNKVLKYKLEDMRIKKPWKWDRKWRVVIFDIPEKYKMGRECLRNKLKELGFYKLQKSVWIYPYSCEDEVDFIGELYEVRSYIRILTVQKIDIQKDLVRLFEL
ncbi:MAG: hypothetical protein HYW51_02825 [Candidatus Doudnabacteria bacterium]|nr:hypothetical protein [Candidatus Doudnabacteria bacterium]